MSCTDLKKIHMAYIYATATGKGIRMAYIYAIRRERVKRILAPLNLKPHKATVIC